ncbi:hypothetical protein CHI06_03400 [Bacillus sp. 7884-1]|nr:hypothetical protein CHI06_03400 [Bacillus sp. 7884-1]
MDTQKDIYAILCEYKIIFKINYPSPCRSDGPLTVQRIHGSWTAFLTVRYPKPPHRHQWKRPSKTSANFIKLKWEPL